MSETVLQEAAQAPAALAAPPHETGVTPDGVFLIHGLGGTQYDLGSMHKRLKNAGFVTHSLTLPGHGTDPKDLNARFALAQVAARDGDLDRAAEELLGILARKRDYRSGEGRLAFLDVLEIMGAHEPRTERYRSRLSMILFS